MPRKPAAPTPKPPGTTIHKTEPRPVFGGATAFNQMDRRFGHRSAFKDKDRSA